MNKDLIGMAGSMSAQKKLWTSEEDTFLRENYLKRTSPEIAQRLGRTVDAIQNRARFLGVTRSLGHRWTKTELDFLRNNYAQMKAKELAKGLNLTLKQTQAKVHAMHLRKGITEEKRQKVLDFVSRGELANRAIALETGMSIGSVQRILRARGIKRRSGLKTQYQLLEGFKYGQHSGASDTRHMILHAYRNTCWDCKKTFINQSDLDIHHDFTELPVRALVLCRVCHGKRHKRKFKLGRSERSD